MSVKLDYQELLAVLKYTPADHNIMLMGKHGIGKSQILAGYYSNLGLKVIPFFLGQMSDPGDLIGLLHKNVSTGHSEFLPPFWWPLDNTPIVLFLDELNRARPELLQTIQDLALNRTLAGKKLPDQSRVIAAINIGDEYQLTDLDPALLSRFNIYEFVPTIDDWVSWAHKVKLDMRVINFIQKNNSFLDPNLTELNEEVIEKMPDRRSWVRVSDIIKPEKKIDLTLAKILSGVVGVNAAMAFKKFIGSMLAVSPEDIMFGYTKATEENLDTLSLQDIIYLNNQLVYWINERAISFTVAENNKGLKNFEKYLKYLQSSKRREAIAEIFNQIEKNKDMDSIRNFIVGSKEVFSLLEKFTSSISM